MEEYNVIISSAGQNDFLEITEFLELLSPEEATVYLDSVLEKTRILAATPEICPFARDSQLRLRGYRVLSVDNYIFFFTMSGKNVYIRRILYARRQYDRVL